MLVVRRLAVVALSVMLAGASFAEQVPLDNTELANVLERVLATHPSADAARAEVSAARSELSGARWARFPGVSVETFADDRDGGTVSAALQVDMPLWTGGRLSAEIRQSKSRLEAALASLDEVYLDLALRTVQSYVDLVTLRRRAAILDESLAEHRKLVDSMARRVEQEISPASELQLARSRMRQTESEVLQARAAAEVAMLSLRELAGDEELDVRARLNYPENAHLPDAAELLSAGLRFDPQRRRIAAQAEIAAEDVTIRKSELLPQLGARYVHHLGDDGDREDQLGLVVSLRTDGGLSRVSAINAARMRERAAQRAVDSARREQRERIMSELASYASARLQVLAGRDAAQAAQSVTESFLRQFAAGRRTWPEVLNAVREAATARLAEVEAEGNAVSAYLRLMLVSGHWRPAGTEELP
ncbi:MAG TPA: TolC family protein [Steroidobacter sp.]